MRLAQGKDEGRMLADLGGRKATAAEALAFVASHAVSRPVLVDVTAEETGDLLHLALGQGFDLVLANKKPLAGARRDATPACSTPRGPRAGASATRPRWARGSP